MKCFKKRKQQNSFVSVKHHTNLRDKLSRVALGMQHTLVSLCTARLTVRVPDGHMSVMCGNGRTLCTHFIIFAAIILIFSQRVYNTPRRNSAESSQRNHKYTRIENTAISDQCPAICRKGYKIQLLTTERQQSHVYLSKYYR